MLEGKRLPAPTRDREREYVTGIDKTSGGIQRFKLGLHGAQLDNAGMIGYMQADSFETWFGSINVWIEELATSSDGWTRDDRLGEFEPDATNRTASCTSVHDRSDSVSAKVHMTHLWVDMQ